MDYNVYRRNSPGPVCTLSAEQVAEIREVYAIYDGARKERRRIQKLLDLTPDEFRRFAKGMRGKKFRGAA